MSLTDEEQLEFQQDVENIKTWWSSARFQSIKRPYSAESIASKRSTFATTYRSNTQAKKLWELLQKNKHNKTTSHTFGALDPAQATQMAQQHLDTVYVSSWQCSSSSSVSNESGPDLADYPIDTVPNKVDHLFSTQLFHDRKQREERLSMTPEQRVSMPKVDYLLPIIANANPGRGGITTIMKLTKLFIERGAAGIHVEDGLTSTRKHGHMTSKVLIPTCEHINRLVAVRAQCDIMAVENLVVTSTNAESATFITSNIDPRDHSFILGATNPALNPLSTVLSEAKSRGIQDFALEAIQDEWMKKADLKRYSTAVVEELIINGNCHLVDEFLNDICLKSHHESRLIAEKKYRVHVFWDWDIPRIGEGFFLYEGSIEAAISRSLNYTDYADMLWIATEKLNMEQAQRFSRNILALSPQSLLCYNLSLSSNCDTDGLKNADINSKIDQLAKLGFTWQLITFGCPRMNVTFTKEYKKNGISPIQPKAREYGIDVYNIKNSQVQTMQM